MPLVSISSSQRRPLPLLNWQATVHHGLPADILSFREGAGGYLAFLGRISPEKRVDRAIEIAKRVGMQLKIAAKVDKGDQEYFKTIKPLLNHPLVEFLGEIRQSEKEDFLGDAYALLFPIDWEEPFGLVIIEAMACGTPVIAYNRGAVPEVVQDGITGFIVNDEEGAVRAVENVPTLDRKKCRQIFEERFTATRMARDYISCYKQLVERRQRS
jgi:glycosyltransferase involved in cell wall biosynthesis